MNRMVFCEAFWWNRVVFPHTSSPRSQHITAHQTLRQKEEQHHGEAGGKLSGRSLDARPTRRRVRLPFGTFPPDMRVLYERTKEHRLANLPGILSPWVVSWLAHHCHSAFSSGVTSFFFSCSLYAACQAVVCTRVCVCGCLLMLESAEQQRSNSEFWVSGFIFLHTSFLFVKQMMWQKDFLWF